MRFYLGTHEPTWLNRSHVPLFVSYLRLRHRCINKLPRAKAPWALDSAGFSVLNKHGHYPWTPEEYARDVRRYDTQIGLLDWVACMDWMCEEVVLKKTGLTVLDHQRCTVRSYLDLRDIAPDLPWVPVLQGYTHVQYLRCLDLYAQHGHDLTDGRLVGIGSVCRRQATDEAEAIIFGLHRRGVRLHGFGFKTLGVERVAHALASADSLAWSDAARKEHNRYKKQGGAHRHPSPSNNPATALDFLRNVRAKAGITDGPCDTRLVCPYCGSADVHPAGSDCLDYCCVECGESFAHIFEPDLLHPKWCA